MGRGLFLFLFLAVRAGGAAAADAPPERWSGTLAAARGRSEFAEVAAGRSFSLPHKFIFAGSEVVAAGGVTGHRGREYTIDYDAGVVTVLASPPYPGPLVVTYEYLPFLQSESYRAALAAESEAEKLEVIEEEAGAGSALDITGSKTFSVAAGNVGGAQFDQSLRLSVKGNVGDVKVTGEISDQSLPMESGGASEELEAVDKVSVRVEGRHLAATFGDYDLDVGGRRFAAYERRLTGIKAEAFYPTWAANAYGARARGRFASNEFYGQDGVQGPYQLSARDDAAIVVLPDTEKVWLNGALLKRGENNDYELDYDMATLTFTVRRPISAQDRVVVDFQYTTEEYQRDFYGGDAGGHFANDAVSAGVLYAFEGDNRDRDLFGLTTFQRERLLPRIGDEVTRARVYARDENGDVLYEYVGEGNGAYTREWDPVAREYLYTYVGEGNGDYNPREILLPVPKRQGLVDVTTTFAPAAVITVTGEGATSSYDANTFSSYDDDDNAGVAGVAVATLRLDEIPLWERVGELELEHRWETRDGRFRALGREDDVAFLAAWDLEDEVAGLERAPGYRLYETTVTETPVPSLSFSAGYGALNQKYTGLSAGGYRDQYAQRVAGAIRWEPPRWPHFTYDFNGVRRRGQRGAPASPLYQFIPKSYLTRDENVRREQNGKVSYDFGRFSPFISGHDKMRRADYGTDGAADDGTLDQELELGTGVRLAPGWDAAASHTWGRGKLVADQAFLPSYRSNEESFRTTYDAPGLIYATGEYHKTVKDYYSRRAEDADGDLALVDIYYTPGQRLLGVKTRYELAGLRAYEREEVFEVAPDGDGDYVRVPDPGDPRRFIYVYDPENPEAIYIRTYRNTGRSYRVLKPEMSADVTVEPFRRNDARGAGAARDRWLDAAALDLYLHARQSSPSAYRFRVATFQRMLGPDALESNLEQRYTVKVLPVARRVTGLARYTREDELDRTISSRRERGWRTSRYAEATGEPARRWTVKGDVERVREWKSVVEENVLGSEDMLATEMIYGLEPTYAVAARLDLKTRGEFSRRREFNNDLPTDIDGYTLKPEVVYRLAESGTVDVWYERKLYDVRGYLGSETLLFRVPGVTHGWEASVTKGVGRYVTLIFAYEGEKRPDEGCPRHRGQMDVDIYF